jgi:hypothetical protein
MRDNVQGDGPEDYFRKSITVPFLDYMVNEMKKRFTDLHARTKVTLFKALHMSSYLSCSDLLKPFLKARHILTITMATTKSKFQMEYNK